MRRTVLLATALAVTSGLAAPAAFAEQSCQVSGGMMSKAAMQKSLIDRGYTQIRSLRTHNGCYEAAGLDKNGKRFELEVNGATGVVQNVE